jgi:hypothetical protein
MRAFRIRPRLLALLGVALLLAACGGDGLPSPTASPSASPTVDLATRPFSPAALQVTSPADRSTATGTKVHVVVSLQNAKVIQATTTTITPTEGHVHLYLDNQLIYMAYSLEQDVTVHPGVYSLRAEFVAADHFPFNPRVYSAPVVFTVQ